MSRANQTFIVTGGASGLGEACVRALAKDGASVVIADRNQEDGERIAAELGSNVVFQTVDVVDEQSCKDTVARAVQMGHPLCGVINCAGVGSAMTTLNRKGPHPLEYFDFVMKVNLYGTFNMARFGAEEMAKNKPDSSGLRGVIVNVASVAAFEGQKGQVSYAASKGAVVGMNLPMARDLARFGIRVNTVAPGIMDTPMMAAASNKVRANLLTSVVAPKRFGMPDEFAQLCLTIIDNKYINAQTFRIDAGIRMANL